MCNLVVCIQTYLSCVLDANSVLADLPVLNYSGLNIALKLNGGRPWILRLLRYGSVPHCKFSCQDLHLFSLHLHRSVTRECVDVSQKCAKAQHCRVGVGRGRSSNQGWRRTVGERTEPWQRAEDTHVVTSVHTSFFFVGCTKVAFLTHALKESLQPLQQVLSSCSFPSLAKNTLFHLCPGLTGNLPFTVRC